MTFKINEMPAPVCGASLEKLARHETVLFGHFLNRGVLDAGLRPVGPVQRIAGTAVTLSLPPQDSTVLHHAAGIVRPGSIIVIERRGDRSHACLGGGVAKAILNSGAVGVVIDGCHTDTAEIVELGLPVWSRGVSALTTRLQGIAGAMNIPVSVGGVPILPGDAILADQHGIVSIHVDELEGALKRAEALQGITDRTIAAVEAGERIGDVSGASRLVAAALKKESA